MKYQDFIDDLLSGKLLVKGTYLQAYIPIVKKILAGEVLDIEDKQSLTLGFYNQNYEAIPPDDDMKEEKSVAIIPIRGIITKYGNWWDYGAEDYAALLYEAYEMDNVEAIILQFHSPGGTTSSSFPLAEAINQRNKSVISLIDNFGYSMGYWFASLTDKIIAVGDMAQVGSVGVKASVIDDSKMLESMGLKIIDIYPPESEWKDKPIREVIKGKKELFIQEELSPWAKHFQDLVIANRPKLNQDIEGIISGRTFFATDAKEYGLVDDIKTMKETIEYAFELGNRNTIEKLY
jgi:protease-4